MCDFPNCNLEGSIQGVVHVEEEDADRFGFEAGPYRFSLCYKHFGKCLGMSLSEIREIRKGMFNREDEQLEE